MGRKIELIFINDLFMCIDGRSRISEKIIAGKKEFNVADGFLIVCFDKDVTEGNRQIKN